jgi:2-polyprenyl-3-methyl-5-hydroxy-6-metoxy-1,4-benzoquinol methylase
MKTRELTNRPCWCGNDQLGPFSPEYLACERCGTLVSRFGLTAEELRVHDDGRDYYGKSYWLEHQSAELELPSIEERAVADLGGRCVHWLRTLVAYRPPPARILEIGSAHGAFVALLQVAGYDATGLELSPWVVDFARSTFGVDMLLGPVESQSLDDGTFDVVVCNDLLEHLPDPAGTIGHCVRLLRPDGVLVLQTPRYPLGRSHTELLRDNDLFLETIGPRMAAEHIYLFSEASVRELLGRFGLNEVQFEPPAHLYDMYLFASRAPVQRQPDATVRCALRATRQGRMVEAWLDADHRARELGNAQHRISQMHTELAAAAARIEVLDCENADKYSQLSRAAQTIHDLRVELVATEARLARAQAELGRFRERVGSPDALAPFAVRIGRALTRLARRLPLRHQVKRLLGRTQRVG